MIVLFANREAFCSGPIFYVVLIDSPGVGVTKPIFFIPFFCLIFKTI